MKNQYSLLSERLKECSENPENHKIIQEFYQSKDKKSFLSLFSSLTSGPAELMHMKLYHLALIYAREGSDPLHTKLLAKNINWFRANQRKMITFELFNEINLLFSSGFKISVKKSNSLRDFSDIIESASWMAEVGACLEEYKPVIFLKLRSMIWSHVIKPLSDGNCKTQEIFDAIAILARWQFSGMHDDNFLNFFIGRILNYVRVKFDFFGIRSSLYSNTDEAKQILFFITNLIVNNHELNSELNQLVQTFGIESPQNYIIDISTPENPEIYSTINKENLIKNSEIYPKRDLLPYLQIKFQTRIWATNKLETAVKIYKIPTSLIESQIIHKVIREISVYQLLSSRANHTNCFLKYFGTIKNNHKIYLCMEHYKKSLEDRIQGILTGNSSKFTSQELKKFITQMINSFSFMEGLNLFHREINPKNFLITPSNQLKFIDFGESEGKNNEETILNWVPRGLDLPTSSFSENYRAPETFQISLKRKASRETSDVFSLGMTILRMVTCKDLTGFNKTGKENDLKGFIQIRISETWIKELLSRMLEFDVSKRLRFEECLQFIPNSGLASGILNTYKNKK